MPESSGSKTETSAMMSSDGVSPTNTSPFEQYQSTAHDPVDSGSSHDVVVGAGAQQPLNNGKIDTTSHREGNTSTSMFGRKMSDPQTSPRYQGSLFQSPPDSPSSTVSSVVSSVNTDRAPTMPVPRTSSIDSAISSMSGSPNHSHKPSTDSNSHTSSEVASLVATAGGVENLIQHLLKEKQQAAAQNAQLWKLVDKQRAMVLGLNKDLERALKDKERYKKKLKELQEQPPPLPQTAIRDDFGTSYKSTSPPSQPPLEAPPPPPVPIARLQAPEQSLNAAPEPSPVEVKLMPSPLHLGAHAHAGPISQVRKDPQTEYLERHPPPAGPPPPPPVSDQRRPSGANAGLVRQPPAPPPTQSLPATPTDESAEEVTPRQNQRSGQSKKAPPAPLNLSKPKDAAPAVRSPGRVSISESEYEEDLEEMKDEERGRRKTREDDDRDRVIASQKAEEARSRSKKVKSAASSPDIRSNVATPTQSGPPSGQRTMVPQLPPDGAVGMVASLDAMLKPDGTQLSGGRDLFASPPMSPGLPTSPRPMDRTANGPSPRPPKDNILPVASPPLSPRFNSLPSNVPLSPRAPIAPIPLPPNTPMSLPSPPTPSQQQAQSPTKNFVPSSPRPGIPVIAADVQVDDFQPLKSPNGPIPSREIFRGYVHEEYPGLLLPPNALPSIDVKVASSRLRPSRHSYMAPRAQDEDPVFTLSVFARSNRTELWRVEKVILSLPQLDQQVKQVSSFTTRLPERKLFTGHSPATIDARRNALNNYFEELLDTPMDEKAALVVCKYLSEDAIEPRDDETSLLAPMKQQATATRGPGGRLNKEGYLTKRGKNFGGWKARFFVLQGPELRYYESPGGAHMGTIKLPHSQIGKQSQGVSPSRNEEDSDNQYRHAFLVLEPKRKDSTSLVRHVLCAESDQERDDWVDALLQYVDYQSDDESNKSTNKLVEPSKNHVTGMEAKVKQYGPGRDAKQGQQQQLSRGEALQGISYESTVPGQPPQRGETPVDRLGEELPSPTGTYNNNAFDQFGMPYESIPNGSVASRSISKPVNGAPIQDAGMWGNKSTNHQTSKQDKKRSIWGFKQRSSSDLLMQVAKNNDSDSSLSQPSRDTSGPIRAVFGLPLSEAVEFCAPVGVNVFLPAVAYRCIAYLRAKNASSEEGIFRLSGSNVVVRRLKEKFDNEGDFDFIADDQYWDVHAVASLLKSYLRELPTTLLTRELHLEFLHVLELDTREAKILAFNELVHRLPAANFSLLRALSGYLLEIVNNADKNKMTVRNVGIVFSPTLNIPAPVFSMFLTEFEKIFTTRSGSALSRKSSLARKDSSRSRRGASGSPATSVRQHSQTPPAAKFDLPEHHAPFPNQQGMPARPNQHRKTLRNSVMVGGSVPPAYEQNRYVSEVSEEQSPQGRMAPGPEYGNSMNQHARIMAPSGATSAKAKRRESSMMFMGGAPGQRKSSMPLLRED